jgi:hypothetical protein
MNSESGNAVICNLIRAVQELKKTADRKQIRSNTDWTHPDSIFFAVRRSRRYYIRDFEKSNCELGCASRFKCNHFFFIINLSPFH